MTGVTIWHNPRCSKSRATLELLRERGIEPTIREYLSDPPNADEIQGALAMLGRPAADLVRVKEPGFRETGLTRNSDEPALVAALVATPRLIERPVVFAMARRQSDARPRRS